MASLTRLTTSATVAVAAIALVAGCSSSPAPSTPPTTSGTTTTEPAPPAGGTGACPDLTDDELASFGLGVQLLAQLRSQSQVDAIVDGVLPYEPSEFAATLDELETLRGYDTGGLGAPGESIDFFRGANEIGGRILAVDGPVPQELFDEYDEYAGEIGEVLGNQLAINVALGDLCE